MEDRGGNMLAFMSHFYLAPFLYAVEKKIC
jgi:hypothetical protein